MDADAIIVVMFETNIIKKINVYCFAFRHNNHHIPINFSQQIFLNYFFLFQYRIKNYASDSDDSDNECEVDVDKMPPLEIGPGEHKLQYSYCLWFHRGLTKTINKNPMVCTVNLFLAKFIV